MHAVTCFHGARETNGVFGSTPQKALENTFYNNIYMAIYTKCHCVHLRVLDMFCANGKQKVGHL